MGAFIIYYGESAVVIVGLLSLTAIVSFVFSSAAKFLQKRTRKSYRRRFPN